MRLVYKFVLLALVSFMLPLNRLQQTARQFLRVIPQTIPKATYSTTSDSNMSEDRPNGTIATKGLELLTFGTPNGKKYSVQHRGRADKECRPQSFNYPRRVERGIWEARLRLPKHQHWTKHPEGAVVHTVRTERPYPSTYRP